VLAGVLALTVLAGCARDGGAAADTDDPPLRVASSSEGEGALLAHVVGELASRTGTDVELVTFADARDGRQALELGAVDVRIGYTGETWLETLGRADPPGDPEASFGPVRAHDAREGIVWLPPRFGGGSDGPPADATFAFVVAGPPSVDADLRTVSQLAARLEEQPDAGVCVDREFGLRQDGLRAVLDAYRVRSDRPFLAATPEEAVRGVAAGDCIAGLATATDGAAWAAGLRPLVDDLEVFPAFVPAVQVRDEVLAARTELETALAPFGDHVTTSLLGGWNAQVAVGAPTEQVAQEAAELLLARADAEAVSEPEGVTDG
jgi:osmoprotectant transport system substrate-binding protein